MHAMLAKMICEVFETVCKGKWQTKNVESKAFVMRFTKRVDHDKEDGYRDFELMLFAPANYVQVWVRETWNVIPQEDLEYNEKEEESFVKKGKDYVKGATPWQLIGNHDSCWRDSVESFLRAKKDDILCLAGPFDYWKMLPAEGLVPEVTDAARKGSVL